MLRSFSAKKCGPKTKETTMILLAAVTYWSYTVCDALSYRHQLCMWFHSQTFFLFFSNRKVIPRILQCSLSRSLLCIKNYLHSVGEVYVTHNLPQDMVWTGKIHTFKKDHNRQRMCIQEYSLHHYLYKQKKKIQNDYQRRGWLGKLWHISY